MAFFYPFGNGTVPFWHIRILMSSAIPQALRGGVLTPPRRSSNHPRRDFVERLWSGGFDQPPTATTRSDSTTGARMLAPSAAPAEGRILLQFCDDFRRNPRKCPQNRLLRFELQNHRQIVSRPLVFPSSFCYCFTCRPRWGLPPSSHNQTLALLISPSLTFQSKRPDPKGVPK